MRPAVGEVFENSSETISLVNGEESFDVLKDDPSWKLICSCIAHLLDDSDDLAVQARSGAFAEPGTLAGDGHVLTGEPADDDIGNGQ